ncbi:COG1361 family protein [Halobacterium noricense]|uniref:hypothetical protein n=1 Tax=Halobacterium noricense TaxID=223182 RepID=UPI001E30C05B|nr:hypothetical protein [Halobacterium noricense]UHH26546.1 hypothetical protein LT974_06300 [Halobacterium noricense]
MIDKAHRMGVLVAIVVLLSTAAFAPITAAQSTPNSDASVTIGEITVAPNEPTTDAEVIITPTVTNSESAGGNARLTEVSVRGQSKLNSADNLGRLGGGDSIEVPLSHTFEDPGTHRVVVTARGTNPDSSVFVVQKSVYITVEERATDVGVTAKAQSVNGSTGIAATVTQYGTVAIESGEVQVRADGEIVDRAPVSNISGSQSQTVSFEGGDIPAGAVTVRAQYRLTDEQQPRTTDTTLRYNPQRAAEMALTGIETTAQGTAYTISGDASNLGSGDANSVLINVAPTEGLSSNGGYFVGSIETSEFATFEVTVTAESTVDELPVQVNYSVDGEQFSEVVPVDVSERVSSDRNAARQQPPQNDTSGGLPVTVLAVGALLLVGLAAVIYRWRVQ